ncbi:MAG TPA: hypothetical protein VMT01_02700 [Candidatus Acidoferrum sp.]|nr:hypothetical protein [Candidatus Acidoferrum sp.]
MEKTPCRIMSNVHKFEKNATCQNEAYWGKTPQIRLLRNMLKIFHTTPKFSCTVG